MTTPQRPGDAITEAAQRLKAQRDAAHRVSREIAEERAVNQRPEAEQSTVEEGG